MVCFCLGCGVGLAQQWKPTETGRSYQRANAILHSALEIYGGKKKIDQIENISFSFNGTHNLPLQNLQPDFSKTPLPKEGKLIFAGKGSLTLLEEKVKRPGVYTGWHRWIADGNKSFDLNLNSNQFRPTSHAALMQKVINFLPHLVLMDALKRPATLRWQGDVDFQGKPHHLICFTNASGQQITLFIEIVGHRLSKYETLASLPVYGDRTWEFVFGKYQFRNGILLPQERLTRLNGVTTENIQYSDIAVNGEVSPSVFSPSTEFVLRDDTAARAKKSISVAEVAKGVYTVDNAQGTDLKILFVVFEKFILAAGAPFGISDAVMDKIKEIVPGKPIRYVVPTHHHSDHAGGLRSYIAEGITIVTTPGNKSFVEELAIASFTISPDKLALYPRAPIIEIINSGKREITDGSQTVQLYNIGPTPHADEMIIVYLPNERIIYQGDLLEIDDDDEITKTTANEVTVYFQQKIKELGLKVERIIGTEGRAATLEDLRKAVELRIQAGY